MVDPQALQRTKVVVRNLPPALSEASLREAVDKAAAGSYDWLAYFPGKIGAKRTVLSRAYIRFISIEAVVEFKTKFDGHVFISSKGAQFRCVPCAGPSWQQL